MSNGTYFSEDLLLAQKAKEYQDRIYKLVWPVSEVRRYEREDEIILDTKYHIDVEITLKNETKLLGQEKCLRNKFSTFNTFTIEFYQNRFTGELGEFFNLGAQFYLHGYWNKNEDGLEKWVLIKILDLVDYFKYKSLEDLERLTRPDTRSNASFFFINYKDIPKELIYSSLNI